MAANTDLQSGVITNSIVGEEANSVTERTIDIPSDRSQETFDDAVKRYLDHPKDETFEERKARINRFRCGG